MINTALPTLNSFRYKVFATLTMHQLQAALRYARSLAILQRSKVILCPSYNKHSCGGGWQQGILVLAPNGQSRFFTPYIYAPVYLSLEQSGFQSNKVEIQANGMTYTNGHFTYKLINSRYIPQFKLYFNRGIRTYMVIE